ncbi:MAG: hypothetical protein GXP31_17590 [Kiritimatiellaeota bacterium]|nr:hypothetical protein [Kiritimatiellota bacterium]
MKHPFRSILLGTPCCAETLPRLLALLLLCGTRTWGGDDGNPTNDEAGNDLESRSRSPYYHLISLYDEDGTIISPDDEPAAPYSPDRTCGKCHDTNRIRRGWHFDAAAPGVAAGRPAQPWILTVPDTVTQIPVSYRPWPGVFRPRDLGLGAWEFLRLFGRHLPGNIDARTDGKTVDPMARWEISGGLEIDCLACHSADGNHNQAERAAQVKRENYRWAPTASSGLATVRGDAAKLPEDYDPFVGPDPDHPEQQPPKVLYDKMRFNADDRVHFAVTRRPSPARCYFCHTNREVGPGAPRDWAVDPDVHLASGLTCTDCHRNGLDHMMVRGFVGEPLAKEHPEIESLSCRGCHLGGAPRPLPLRGRNGAPYPQHAGLPAFHLDKLSCTACHSGLRPTVATRRIQTSRAHGLGLARKGRRDDALPWITEPVFMVDTDGRIRPYRAFWPAWWGRMVDGRAIPLAPQIVRNSVPERSRRKPRHDAVWTPFSRGKIATVLQALAARDDVTGEPVYVCAGKLYRLASGQLRETPYPEAGMFSWPIAHDVRPAGQALGAEGCADCHASGAPFFFGEIEVRPSVDGAPFKVGRLDLMGGDRRLMRAWSRVLAFRGPAIAVSAVSAFIVLGTLIHYAFLGLAGLPRKPR